MKPGLALTLTTLFLAFGGFRAVSQEHVDVPLPPYDPPPTVSHHHNSQYEAAPVPSRTTRKQSHSVPKRSFSKPKARSGVRNTKTAHFDRRHHRQGTRHKSRSYVHWPWQHHSARKISRKATLSAKEG
jgi:hypothetical protein